jgi:hypothetical protein
MLKIEEDQKIIQCEVDKGVVYITQGMERRCYPFQEANYSKLE